MKLGNEARFALGMVLFSPLFAVEDCLKALGVKDAGLVHNKEGKSIITICREEAAIAAGKRVIDAMSAEQRVDTLVAGARAAGSMAKVVRSLVNDPDAILNPNSEISRRLAELGIVLKD